MTGGHSFVQRGMSLDTARQFYKRARSAIGAIRVSALDRLIAFEDKQR